MGQFTVVMEDTLAPITSGNFLSLVNQKYYDGVIFHRVIDNFMIQGGDPTGTGSGGPGYTIDDEFHISLSNVQGTISMANSGPNTGGSQFFINLVNNTYLDFNKSPFTSKHPVFGHVIDSFEVVQRIGRVQTNSSDRPVNEVRMDSVREVRFYAGPALPEYEDHAIIYPNPATSVPYVQFAYNDVFDSFYYPILVETEIVNRYGQVVWEGVKLVGPSSRIRLDEVMSSDLTSGLYYLTISSDEFGDVKLKLFIP